MNTQSQQEVANALRDLEPEEALSVVTNWLSAQDIPRKLWLPEDVESWFEVEADADDWSDEKRTFVMENAQESSYWRGLADCTDSDWERVALAVQEAVDAWNEKV